MNWRSWGGELLPAMGGWVWEGLSEQNQITLGVLQLAFVGEHRKVVQPIWYPQQVKSTWGWKKVWRLQSFSQDNYMKKNEEQVVGNDINRHWHLAPPPVMDVSSQNSCQLTGSPRPFLSSRSSPAKCWPSCCTSSSSAPLPGCWWRGCTSTAWSSRYSVQRAARTTTTTGLAGVSVLAHCWGWQGHTGFIKILWDSLAPPPKLLCHSTREDYFPFI